jgi:hypothetical protein
MRVQAGAAAPAMRVQAAAGAPARVGVHMQPAPRTLTLCLPQSIEYNGRVYKSLADHDPHSTAAINERDNLYNLGAGWRLCAKTPDALHVCKTYPWATEALVFEDGSAHWTALAPSQHSSLEPGAHFNS